MNDLDTLALKYSADKWGKHHYTPVYYDIFKARRNTVKKVIEIGTGEGASIAMWADFFPYARVYGADIDPKRVTLKSHSRIEIIGCDQSKEQDLINLVARSGTNIDLFVDDGSHLPQDQLFTCLTVMPYLSKKTVYVIEDVADPSIVNHLNEYGCQTIKVGKRYDDRLVIVRHKNG